MSRSAAIVLPWVLSCVTAVACRYSVRDTGFVDLGTEPYRLVLHVQPGETGTWRTDFEQSAAAVFIDSNLRLTMENSPADPANRLVLHAPDGRRLGLGPANWPPASRTDVVALLERTTRSRARTLLQDELLRAYAVLVLVEGEDTAANRHARTVLKDASNAIARHFPNMPKAVTAKAPSILAITPREIAEESVLVWGLGMEPNPAREPRAAVVFGRGRRVGEPLEGGMIHRTAIQDRLAIIGQDCECDLDRGFLQGPVIPARWDEARQQAAASLLGFDPENPRIRAEISRIVFQGPVKPGAKRSPTGAFDALALGYSEEPIDSPSSAPIATHVPQGNTPSAGPPTERPASESSSIRPAMLGVWLAFSGTSLCLASLGLWLLFRSRKDRP